MSGLFMPSSQPTNHLQSAEAQFPYYQIQSLDGYGLPTFSQPFVLPNQTDTGAPGKKSKKGSQTLVNGKQLMDATAGSLVVGDAVSYFVCPLESCSERLSPDAPLDELWDHCSDSLHNMGLLDQGHYPCEVGREEGFADPVHRLLHYSEARCTEEKLPDDKCFEHLCGWYATQALGKRVTLMRSKFYQHYIGKHASEAFNKRNAPFQNQRCKIGFRSKATMFYRIIGGAAGKVKLVCPGVSCIHRDNVLRQFDAGANTRSDV
jgi:hypothetical protein